MLKLLATHVRRSSKYHECWATMRSSEPSYASSSVFGDKWTTMWRFLVQVRSGAWDLLSSDLCSTDRMKLFLTLCLGCGQSILSDLADSHRYHCLRSILLGSAVLVGSSNRSCSRKDTIGTLLQVSSGTFDSSNVGAATCAIVNAGVGVHVGFRQRSQTGVFL